jgi:hypothetical protein
MQGASPPFLAPILSKGLNSGPLGLNGGICANRPGFGGSKLSSVFLLPRENGRLQTKNGFQEAHKGRIEPFEAHKIVAAVHV